MAKPGTQPSLTVIAMNVEQDALTRFFEFFALITAIIFASSLSSNGSFGDGAFVTLAGCDDVTAIDMWLSAQAFSIQYGLATTIFCLVAMLTIGIINRPSGVYPREASAEVFAKFTPWRRFLVLVVVVILFLILALALTAIYAARMIQAQNHCERRVWCRSEDISVNGTLTVSEATFDSVCGGEHPYTNLYTGSGPDCYGCLMQSSKHSHGVVAWGCCALAGLSLLGGSIYFQWGTAPAASPDAGGDSANGIGF